jgi:hypothetical protein
MWKLWKWIHRDYPAPSEQRMAADRVSNRRGAIVLLALSLIPLAVTIAMWLPDRELAKGTRVDAEVVEVVSIRQTSKGPPDTSVVRVRFTTDQGELVNTTVRTTRRQFGRSLAITYDPDNPTNVRAVEGAEVAWRVPLIIGASMAGIGLYCAWTAFRLGRGRPSRLYRRTAVRFRADVAAAF